MTTKIISWNVNGVRAIQKKGFIDWFKKEAPTILCLQETKAEKEQLNDELLNVPGYESHWRSCEIRKGYCGVATYTKIKPKNILTGIEVPEFDREGRILITEFDDFLLFNTYYPNGLKNEERLQYKLKFYDAILENWEKYRKDGYSLVLGGDFNTAHHPIDLARPKPNEKNSGFLPIEREWLDKIEKLGYVDVFRHLNPDLADQYTWWDYKSRARDRNVGWRIDYFWVTEDLLPKVKSAKIYNDVMGSDHCPVGIEIH